MFFVIDVPVDPIKGESHHGQLSKGVFLVIGAIKRMVHLKQAQ